MKHLFAPVFVITLLFFPLFAFASALEKSKIVHIVTEFSDAKAGGLGAVVNEIVTLQKAQGHDVTVILPMFHNDDETPAYKFLDISTSIGQPKEIQATVGSSVIHALVYDYNIFMAGQQIKLKAIKPLGEFAYLTKIRNPSNPYILSDSAIRATLDLWQKNDNEIKEARQDIEKTLTLI